MTTPSSGKKAFAYIGQDGNEWCVYSGSDYRYLLASCDVESTAKFLCQEAQHAFDEAVSAAVREKLDEAAKIVCVRCRNGEPSTYEKTTYSGMKWCHEAWMCSASEIRALAQEVK